MLDDTISYTGICKYVSPITNLPTINIDIVLLNIIESHDSVSEKSTPVTSATRIQSRFLTQGRIQGLEKGGGSKVMYEAPKARIEAQRAWDGVGVGGAGNPASQPFDVFFFIKQLKWCNLGHP